MTTGSGNWSMTAPSVPPKTIMAAVGCTIWPRFPPSSRRPARIPPNARMIPPRLDLSTLSLSLGLTAAWIGRPGDECVGRRRVPGKGESLKYRASEVDDAGEHFADFFENHNFFARDQSDQGVRRLLDELDQVGIDGEGLVVETRELNHGGPALSLVLMARRRIHGPLWGKIGGRDGGFREGNEG